MAIKDMFIEAYEAQEKQEAEAREERIVELTHQTLAAFERLTGEELEPENITDGNIITLNGLSLLFDSKRGTAGGWLVKGSCPLCEAECWSVTCYNKESIGAELASFTPNREHVCNVSKPAQSTPADYKTRPQLIEEARKNFLAGQELAAEYTQASDSYLRVAQTAALVAIADALDSIVRNGLTVIKL